MAFWDKLSSRGRVEDRRSMAPVAGGLSLASVALYLIINYVATGEVDLGQVLGQLQEVQVPEQQNIDPEAFRGADEYEVFASTVLGSNNDMWQALFAQSGEIYEAPTLVLFRTATQSSCGTATSQVGPHYCPLDDTIYLDETFFDELRNRFGAEGGDVAEAYVIAHEVAHHAQNQLGVLDQVNEISTSDPSTSNELSIRQELQADCFAGLWAHSIKHLGIFEPGEIAEAMDAAAAVGDDRIQEKVTGRIQPENWTHGSSEQRVEWFTRGFETGTLSSCNTF